MPSLVAITSQGVVALWTIASYIHDQIDVAYLKIDRLIKREGNGAMVASNRWANLTQIKLRFETFSNR